MIKNAIRAKMKRGKDHCTGPFVKGEQAALSYMDGEVKRN